MLGVGEEFISSHCKPDLNIVTLQNKGHVTCKHHYMYFPHRSTPSNQPIAFFVGTATF